MLRPIPLAAAFAVWMGAAHADDFTDAIVANLTDLGYEFIEVKNGISQTKVEAIRGSDKLEVIYDRTTGKILKEERERADADEVGRSGLEVQNRNEDFLDDEDDEGDDERGDEDGDEHDEDHDENDEDENDDEDEDDSENDEGDSGEGDESDNEDEDDDE